ncbi:MAG: CBS and ACT domain-containing protein [Gemmatimonadota bacterium]|nr:CBS and ACT domain-containing protein [Gemmatimonadota bacterium]
MSRAPVTVTPDDTLTHALDLTRARKIRHLPVVSGGVHLTGILSDRDIRLAMPSPLTVEDHERADFLARTPVAAVMTRDVVTITGRDTVEDAAKMLRRHRIGSLPVVDARGVLEGMITGTDILHAFVQILGGTEPSSRMEVALDDRPGELARAIHVIGEELELNIVSIVVPSSRGGERKTAILHLDTIDPREALSALRDAGFEVGWPSLEDLRDGPGA